MHPPTYTANTPLISHGKSTTLPHCCCPQVKNRENVAKFALRGPGKPGPAPVSAPLSDPTAIPALEYLNDMDCALRHLAHTLLLGSPEAKQASQHPLKVRQARTMHWMGPGYNQVGMQAPNLIHA